MIIASWGRPVDTVVADAVPSSTTTPRDKKAYQAEMTLSSSPRELTSHEAQTVLAQTVHQWAATNPEAELKYVEIEQSSPQVLRFQFISHKQPGFAIFTIGAIAVALGHLLAWIALHALQIIIAVAVGVICLMLIRLPDYFISPTIYECPFCDPPRQFSTYEALVAHIQAEHPGKPIPPRPPTDIWQKLGLIAIAVTAIIGAGFAYRYGIRPMMAKKPKKPPVKVERKVS